PPPPPPPPPLFFFHADAGLPDVYKRQTVPVSSLRNEALGYSGLQPAALKSITPGTMEGPAGLFSTCLLYTSDAAD
ncbi:hypothetical protein QN353_21450, partial [Undibacterium sp. 10I3]